MGLIDKLMATERRHSELSALLGQPDTMAKPSLFADLSREFAELDPVVIAFQEYQKLKTEAEEAEQMLADPDSDAEMKEMAREEGEDLKGRMEKLFGELQIMLLPKDPDDDKNVILEIRAGPGGDEAALFSGDLFRMYGKYAEEKRWKIDILSSHATDLGGYKEVIAHVSGKGAFAELKFESGVHRVQRIPVTETGGRIHTSACTVAVLPEADEVSVNIPEKDIRVDVYRSSGPGGQSVNTTDSAVRITHLPTGLVVTCQDEKSQLKNKNKAMKVLHARLHDLKRQQADDERSEARRSQVGSGDRSERIRTYNFPQGRVTDHRIHLTLHRLDQVMEGDLEEIISSLRTDHQARMLAQII